MDAKTFFSKVCAMRKAQKAYFQTRDVKVLRQSKALEKEIDDEIARVAAMNLQEPPRQPKQREFHWER
jgi:hypothetical protein